MSDGRGAPRRARAIRPPTSASRTGSYGLLSASPAPDQRFLRAFAAAAAAAATRGPCVRAAREEETALGRRQLPPQRVRQQARGHRVRRNQARHRHMVAYPASLAESGRHGLSQLPRRVRSWAGVRFPRGGLALSPSREALCPLIPKRTIASPFASVIQDHLELKKQNAELDGDMPLDRYQIEDPFENHPLFKSEEQARFEETLDGEPAASCTLALALAGRGHGRGPEPRAPPSTATSGDALATSTGATNPWATGSTVLPRPRSRGGPLQRPVSRRIRDDAGFERHVRARRRRPASSAAAASGRDGGTGPPRPGARPRSRAARRAPSRSRGSRPRAGPSRAGAR